MPTLLGVRIDHVTKKQALERCQQWLVDADVSAKFVVTPNPEILVYAALHPDIRAILNQADLALADGSGVVWLAQPKLPERVTGTDVMYDLLGFIEQQQLTVGFVLRPDGLSTKEQLAVGLQKHWPALSCQIIYATEEFTSQTPTLIFVALGCPAQEEWWASHKTKLPTVTRLVMTVGGGVDFITGQTKRAPSFFRTIGLEWLWRLAWQPRRWHRILTATIIFPWYVLTRTNKNS